LIFGNEEKKEILISFLNAVLDLQGEKEIDDIEMLTPSQLPLFYRRNHHFYLSS